MRMYIPGNIGISASSASSLIVQCVTICPYVLDVAASDTYNQKTCRKVLNLQLRTQIEQCYLFLSVSPAMPYFDTVFSQGLAMVPGEWINYRPTYKVTRVLSRAERTRARQTRRDPDGIPSVPTVSSVDPETIPR